MSNKKHLPTYTELSAMKYMLQYKKKWQIFTYKKISSDSFFFLCIYDSPYLF